MKLFPRNMMTHRLCALNGEEDYPVSRITGRRAPEIGLNGGVISDRDVCRMLYRDLIVETVTRTGCGGEGYCAGVEHVQEGVVPHALPQSADDVDYLDLSDVPLESRHVMWSMYADVLDGTNGQRPPRPLFDDAIRENVIVQEWRKGKPGVGNK